MLEIRGVSKSFDDVIVLREASFSVEEGSIFGLLGVNGAGKSTLLRIIAGILKADEGEIMLDGEAVGGSLAAKQRIFYLPDDFYYFPNATVKSMGDIYESVYADFSMVRYRELYEELGFDDVRKIRTFSKGMKKQISILLALCSTADYLLCDEIFDGLDPLIRQEIQDILLREVERRKLTLIIASHDLRGTESMCNCIGIVHRGGIKIVEGSVKADDIKTLIS